MTTRLTTTLTAIVAVALMAACSGSADALGDAAVLCAEGDSHVAVDDGGLFMEGEGVESDGTTYERIACVLAELDTPRSVVSRIDNTNSTMGLVEGSWGDYEASWTYHPDNGLAIHIQTANN